MNKTRQADETVNFQHYFKVIIRQKSKIYSLDYLSCFIHNLNCKISKNKLAKTPSDKAELFQFLLLFCVPTKSSHHLFHPNFESQLREIGLSECDVANCLGNLKTSKASGSDGIPAHLLKECS